MPENDLPRLTRTGELQSSKSCTQRLLEQPFLNAAAHSLVQGPLDAAAQVIDRTTGSTCLPGLRLIPDAAKTEFGSSDWLQQQAGGAIGALPYLVLLHQGSKSLLGKSMLSADTRLLMDAGVKLGGKASMQVARFELASAGLTGLAYGGLLSPVRPEETLNGHDFAVAKLRNGFVGAGTFMTMHAGMLTSKSLAGGFKPGLVQTLMKSDVGSGILSGATAGVFASQADSILRGKGLASLKDSAESAVGFSLIGAMMPAAGKGARFMSERFAGSAKASDVLPIESLSKTDVRDLKCPLEAPSVLPAKSIFSPEQLSKINQWKEAQSLLPESKLRITDPEFIAALANEAYGTGAPVKGRELHILLGNCGSGKSRITEALAKERGAMTPDSDLLKPKIPGYEKGLGNQAVHEDSSAAYKILLDRALANGDNIIWQGVGKTSKSIVDLIAQAKGQNYKVVVHMVDAPPEISALRVFDRANRNPDPETGIRQMIPPEVPINPKYQYVPRQNFFKMLAEAAEAHHNGQPSMIDGFKLWRSTPEISSKLPAPRALPNLEARSLEASRSSDENSQPQLFKSNIELSTFVPGLKK